MASNMTLDGRVAIVTGCGRGLGEAQTRAIHRSGAKVLCTDILPDGGERLAEELGPDVHFLRHDVSRRDEWERAVGEAEQRFGPVSILVNNAGILLLRKIETISEADYRRVVDVNQISVLLGIQSVIPSMRRAGGGSIVNISSTAGMGAAPLLVAYSASKFAVRGITKVAALELAVDNIRVNSVHPGSIRTEMTRDFPEPAGTPIRRWGEASEIADMVVFLASSASSFCTGSEFVADGGQTAVLSSTT